MGLYNAKRNARNLAQSLAWSICFSNEEKRKYRQEKVLDNITNLDRKLNLLKLA